MPFEMQNRLVVAISSRALFDLSKENHIFDSQGVDAFADYQRSHETELLKPGTGFHLVKSLLTLNEFLPGDRGIEVVILSRNNADTSLRIWRSIEHYGLPITRAAFTGGQAVAGYLKPYSADLFLSADAADVTAAFCADVPAAFVYGPPHKHKESQSDEIRVAFDGDAVLFDEESERIYQEQGITAFHSHEHTNARTPLRQGPFAKLLVSLAYIQRHLPADKQLIKIQLVTARNWPAQERIIHTLRAWKIRVDEVHFLGGIEKAGILEVCKPHIFFDDQASHCAPASSLVPTARVPSNLFTMAGTETPLCPRCGAKMHRRVAERGATSGKPFWGCSNYPRCNGNISIA